MVNEQIGKKIKQLRLKNNLTQEELASRVEVSAGFISQLETGKTSINVETLSNIVEVLGATLASFFKNSSEDTVIYKKEDFFQVTSNDYLIDWVISDSVNKKVEPIIVTINENSSSEEVGIFDGEAFGLILEGKCILTYGQKEGILEKGDAFYLKCNLPHKLSCKKKENAKVLWITTPPGF